MKNLLAILILFYVLPTESSARIPDYTQMYYDARNHAMKVWVRHRTLDNRNHRIAKYEILYDGYKAELLKKDQDGFETVVSIPLGDAEPPKGTIVTLRLTCSVAGSSEYHYQF